MRKLTTNEAQIAMQVHAANSARACSPPGHVRVLLLAEPELVGAEALDIGVILDQAKSVDPGVFNAIVATVVQNYGAKAVRGCRIVSAPPVRPAGFSSSPFSQPIVMSYRIDPLQTPVSGPSSSGPPCDAREAFDDARSYLQDMMHDLSIEFDESSGFTTPEDLREVYAQHVRFAKELDAVVEKVKEQADVLYKRAKRA